VSPTVKPTSSPVLVASSSNTQVAFVGSPGFFAVVIVFAVVIPVAIILAAFCYWQRSTKKRATARQNKDYAMVSLVGVSTAADEGDDEIDFR